MNIIHRKWKSILFPTTKGVNTSIVILIFFSPEGPNMEDWGGEESDGLPPKLFMLEPACKFSFTILKFISETEMQDSVTIQL